MNARVGIIGVGGAGAMHLKAYLSAPDLRVVAIADVDESRLYGVKVPPEVSRYTNHNDLLTAGELDAVCVATPVATHETVVEDCAKNGIDVLCEKPLEATVEAAERMVSACRYHKVLLGYAASYRYLPAVRRAKEIVQSGALGEILFLQEQSIGGADIGEPQPMGFAHYPEGGPGGGGMGLVDHGVHFIDAFPWILGDEVVEVSGRGNISGEAMGSEWFVMKFAGGAVAMLCYNESVCSPTTPHEGLFSLGEGWDVGSGLVTAGQWSKTPSNFSICGTKGALRVYHYANRLFQSVGGTVTEIPLHEPPAPAHFAAQMREFANAAMNGVSAPVSAEDGVRALRLLNDVY
ncbi:MAG: Gfo/Idh/MocA family oxidoreductase [Pseudomonadota bacterium]